MEVKPAEVKSVATRTSLTLNREIGFVLSHFEVWLPLDAYDVSTPVGCASVSVSAQYKTAQRYNKLNASDGTLVRTEFLSMNDDAQVDIKHITVYAGIADPNMEMIEAGRAQHLLEPSRISLGYRCFKADDTHS